jgi:hypothetical protein
VHPARPSIAPEHRAHTLGQIHVPGRGQRDSGRVSGRWAALANPEWTVRHLELGQAEPRLARM